MEAAKEEKVDNSNKIEKPKFKVGDWVVDKNGTVQQILSYKNGIYKHTNGYSSKMFEDEWRLWDITKDAKNGDVLCCENGWTCIFKTLVNDETFSSYCFMDNAKWFCETGSECHTLKEEFVKAYNSKIHPATKEQRDIFFAKMKEAGYEWDAEKKELKKIGQKPTWSEEDERNLQGIIDEIEANKNQAPDYDLVTYDRFLSWLKSLKDKVQPKQEWNEQEQVRINRIVSCLENLNVADNDILLKDVDWLKSLRPQSQWKPSDEQMLAINTAINVLGKGTLNGKQLIELQEQLKELK